MNVNSITSIYIPRMAAFHNELNIKNIMAEYCIGHISHIDFTPINQKPGFGENVNNVVKSAFIHFVDTSSYLNGFSRVENDEGIVGNFEFWETIASGQPYKLQINQHEYWLCLINKNPVQRTMMNIHQVVENGRHLENIVREQDKKIRELEEKLENTHQVLYQLVGGLFCHEKQSSTLDCYVDTLFGTENRNRLITGNQYPTTRQGDECEQRLNILEKAIFGSEYQYTTPNSGVNNDDSSIATSMIEDDMDSVS